MIKRIAIVVAGFAIATGSFVAVPAESQAMRKATFELVRPRPAPCPIMGGACYRPWL